METNGEALVIKYLIKNHDVVFDVGANIGEWSSAVLHQAPKATLHAFEPLPMCYEQLKKKISSRFYCYPLALSNTKGVANFVYYPENSVVSTFYHRPILSQVYRFTPIACKVSTITLDEFCKDKGINHIDFLKIDTEGAESAIINGAKYMIEQGNIGIIQFEYGGTYQDAATTLHDIYKYLTNNFYSIYRITGNGLLPVDTWHNALENYRYSNYVAVYINPHKKRHN
jgi:FkbM family methyltransferase